MDIFGIGPLEFFLILIVALIVFGPNDLAKAGRTLGKTLRKLATSEEWRIISQSAREFRNIPKRLMSETGVEEIKKEFPDIKRDLDLDGLNKEIKDWGKDVSSWTKEVNQAQVENPATQEPSISPPKTAQTTKPAPVTSKTSPQKKPTFSWDEPDILPDEDDK